MRILKKLNYDTETIRSIFKSYSYRRNRKKYALRENVVSTTRCKEILNKGKRKFTDKEVNEIKELLELFVKQTIKLYKKTNPV